jgi:hypothetical protein
MSRNGLAPTPAGNDRAITHDAYARLRLSDAAGETAYTLHQIVPLEHDADTPTIEAFAFVLEQMGAAAAALEGASPCRRETRRVRKYEKHAKRRANLGTSSWLKPRR